MNSSGIRAIFVVSIGLLAGLGLTFSAYGSGRNLLAAIYGYIPFVFAVIGFLNPKFAVYILFACGAFLGLVKKFLVLDGRYGFDTMFSLMGAPAILLLGACVATALRMLIKGRVSRRDIMVVVAFCVVSILMMALVYLKQRKIPIAIMAGAYVNIVWVMFMNFRSPGDLLKLKWFTLIMAAGSCLVGYYQLTVGLTPLDLQYLEYGYVSNLSEFNPANPRPFATYGSSGQYGWAMVFAVALALTMLREARQSNEPLHKKIILFFLLVLLFGAVFTSQKKAPIVGLAVLPFAILCSRSALASASGFMAIVLTVVFLAFNGDFASQVLRNWSFELTKIDADLTLNSFNARIRSFEGILDTESISLVGPGSKTAVSHSLLTDVLLVVGYVPAIVGTLFGLGAFFWAQRWVRRKVGHWKSPDGREVAVSIGFFLTLLAGSVIGTSAYQAFPGSLYWWTSVAYAALYLYRVDERRREARGARDAAAQAPYVGPAPLGRPPGFAPPRPRPAHSRSGGM